MANAGSVPRSSSRHISPHSLQHVLDRAFCKRELLWIAGAQYHIRAGPVLRIEERIAPDRDRRVGLGDLAELHADVALARIRAKVSESMRTPTLSLGATSSSIACMIEARPASRLHCRSKSRARLTPY
jgi:hypothetical protein